MKLKLFYTSRRLVAELSKDLYDLVFQRACAVYIYNPLKLAVELKIYFPGLLFSRAHILRTLLNIHRRQGACLDGGLQKISASRFIILWFLYTGFYCITNRRRFGLLYFRP